MAKREFIPNQIFVGLPWKTVRPKYERIIAKLEKKFPLHLTIVGRNDGHDAEDLFETIKLRITSSSYAIFDATGGNANVSLEYGYAEGKDIPRAIFLSAHKASSSKDASSPIISDLTGKRRVPYKTETALSVELHKLAREHDYVARFEKALVVLGRGKKKGDKKRIRALVLKVIRALAGKETVRRAQVVQNLQAQGYSEKEADNILKRLHSTGIVKTTVGKFSDVYVA